MVTVVGAGPVGLTVAALLGGAGHAVRVLERRREPTARPRAVHLDHQAARILDGAGVMGALSDRVEVMDAYEWRGAAGQVLLRIEPEGPLGRSGWPESLMFHQPDLEAALRQRLAGLDGVAVEWGREVASADDLDSLVADGGWVVACDGANSRVRELLGIGRDGGGHPGPAPSEEWLILDVIEAEARRWSPCNLQVCDPARPTTAVSGGPGRRRFEILCRRGEDPAELDTEEAAWRLLAPWGLRPGHDILERHARYRFGAGVVRRWGTGRVLLAGDAAHQMPPFAGQGLCAGLRDAANLSWKLDMVLRGTAEAGLLGTYGTERAAQVRTEIDVSVALGAIVCAADPVVAAQRDRDMAAAFAVSGPVPPPPLPPLGPGLLRPGDPVAGTLAPQGVVSVAGRRGRADDVIGRGWVLHGRDSNPVDHLSRDLRRWWAALGGRGLDCSGAGTPYPRWFAETGSAVIAVRPDFAAYGSAAEPTGANALVRAVLSQLATFAPGPANRAGGGDDGG